MILGFDVGNTHISPIIFDENGNIIAKFRIPTQLPMTEDTLFSTVKTLCENMQLDIMSISDIIISSVVPHLNDIFVYLSEKYFNRTAYFVSLSQVEKSIILPTHAERGLGADRIIDILACQKLHPNKTFIVIDFGTATTIDVIQNNLYVTGAILPGINLSIQTLFKQTAKLPKISFEKPKDILAVNTIEQIKVGIYYGNVAAIRELIENYKNIHPDAYVITTGGQGKSISDSLSIIDEYIPDLTYIGLFTFYEMIKKNK